MLQVICFKDKIYTKNTNCIKIWNNVYSRTKYIKDITYGEIWYKKPWKMMQKIIKFENQRVILALGCEYIDQIKSY